MTDHITLPRTVVEQVREAFKELDYASEPYVNEIARAALAALDAALKEPEQKPEQYPEKGSALSVYNEITTTDDPGSPLERLRFFCSLAMRPQDWLDAKPFFDALAEPEKETFAQRLTRRSWEAHRAALAEPEKERAEAGTPARGVDATAGEIDSSHGAAYREHITDGSPCWCNPELNYRDPETGAEVWVHRREQ